jgi:molybdate transport system substrate-binding protein
MMSRLILVVSIWTGLTAQHEAPAGRPRADGGPITVSAAISLSGALEEIAAAYEKSGGAAIRFNFAGSNVLARQIVNGAPVDLFISADEAQMDLVERAGTLVSASRRPIVANQLAVAALPDRVEAVRSAFARAGSEIRRLAIGDPSAVPAGVYARQYLERQGLWKAYAGRIVPTGNVRAALAAVENGSADAAIVYVTDLYETRTARAAITLARGQTPPITYPAAVIATARNRETAQHFLAFLESATARAVFLEHGFLPPPVR